MLSTVFLCWLFFVLGSYVIHGLKGFRVILNTADTLSDNVLLIFLVGNRKIASTVLHLMPVRLTASSLHSDICKWLWTSFQKASNSINSHLRALQSVLTVRPALYKQDLGRLLAHTTTRHAFCVVARIFSLFLSVIDQSLVGRSIPSVYSWSKTHPIWLSLAFELTA